MTWAPCPHGVRTRGKKKVETWLQPSPNTIQLVEEKATAFGRSYKHPQTACTACDLQENYDDMLEVFYEAADDDLEPNEVKSMRVSFEEDPMDDESLYSTTCQLTLTTLAGEDLFMPMCVREHDRLDELESSGRTGRCEVDPIYPGTQKPLKDPIWDVLRSCSVMVARLPMTPESHPRPSKNLGRHPI